MTTVTNSPNVVSVIDELIRNRRDFLVRLETGDSPARIAEALLLAIVVSGAVFGAAVGSHRGGIQILFAALKIPLVVLAVVTLVAPAFGAIRFVLFGRGDLRRDTLLVLAAAALGTMVLAALTPVMVLAMRWGVSYHRLTLLTVGCCLVGGLVGTVFFVHGLRRYSGSGKVVAFLTVSVILLLVGAQAAWTLRPYLLRPRSPNAVFVRSLEGSFLEAVNESINSATGHYRRARASLPGEAP